MRDDARGAYPADHIFAQPEGLTEPEKLLAACFRSSTVGLAILDDQLRFIAINGKLAEINGVPAAEHLGKTVREVLGDFADVIEPKLRSVLATAEPEHFEVSAKLRSEPGHWVVHYLPIAASTGVITRVGVVVVEVTTQKNLEQSLEQVGGKLRKEMDQLQMLLDISSIMASNTNLQQTFPRISARIRRVLHHEYAGFEAHDPITGLLVRQAEDFPLAKNPAPALPVSPDTGPFGLSLSEGEPLIFSKEQMQGFDSESSNRFLAEGIRSLCCIPLLRPQGPLGVLVLGSTRNEAFQPNDLTLLNQVAAQLAIVLENQRAAQEIQKLKKRLSDEKAHVAGEISSGAEFGEIIGKSAALVAVLDQVATVAPSEATVLILGETGTGKELIARAIHRLSRRKNEPFVKLNCAAIPTGLLESELFGHERGAFTGAISQKVGRLELAHGGTLFLDEVGEIPLELQPKLLRVLQDHEFERLGSNHTIKVNLRLLAATNRDLPKSIAQHQFRSDLYYRLSVFPIQIPPLRERRDDIALLVRYFIRKLGPRMGRHIETIPNEAMKALLAWTWPGNIRELENLIERSVILSQGSVLRVPLSELRTDLNRADPGSVQPIDQSLDAAEREHIIRVLRETGGVLSGPGGAARRLNLKRTTLQSKMQRLKITRADYSANTDC